MESSLSLSPHLPESYSFFNAYMLFSSQKDLCQSPSQVILFFSLWYSSEILVFLFGHSFILFLLLLSYLCRPQAVIWNSFWVYLKPSELIRTDVTCMFSTFLVFPWTVFPTAHGSVSHHPPVSESIRKPPFPALPVSVLTLLVSTQKLTLKRDFLLPDFQCLQATITSHLDHGNSCITGIPVALLDLHPHYWISQRDH